MMGVAKDLLAEGGAIAAKLAETGFTATMNEAYVQIEQSQWITRHWDAFAGLSDKLRQLDYSFLGLDLGMQPKLNVLWDNELYGAWNGERTAIAALLLIPVLAGVLTWLQTKVSSAKPKVAEGDKPDSTQQTMSAMNIVMPLITVYFAYIMPAALGIYWIASSLFAILQDVVVNKTYGKKLEAEFAEKNAERAKKQAEIEAKRAETERLRAENATEKNTNTSKKKNNRANREQQREKAQEYERKKSGEEPVYEPSRVGDRKYARGRAYDPDRYTRPEGEAAPELEETVETDVLPEVTEDIADTAEELTEEIVEVDEEYEEEFCEDEDVCDEEEETDAE